MIILNEENRKLFGEQVNDHIAKLNDLMMLGAGEKFIEPVMQKISFANGLLAGSLRMLGMHEWSETLNQFGILMDKAAASTGCWDEALSQIVSELLEAEEQVVAELMKEGPGELELDGKFFGIQQEINVLLEESFYQVDPDTGQDGSTDPVEASVPVNSDETIFPIPSAGIDHSDRSADENFNTMNRLIASLEKVNEKLNSYLVEPKGEAGIRDLELAYGESEFFLGLVGNILKQLGNRNNSFSAKVSSQTVLDGVEDFSGINTRMHGWRSKIELSADAFSLERKVASDLAKILENCIFDINSMYCEREDIDLLVNVKITSEGLYLVATISDNGPDFLSDSRVDRDDTVAFYKGLLEVRSILKKWGCLLWVEPENGRGGRFKFTFPRTTVMTEYHLLNGSGNSFAVASRSVEDSIDMEDVQWDEESHRRYVIISEKSVPVCRIDELATEDIKTEVEGDKVVIIGQAEERIGIITSGPLQKTEGIVEQLVEGVWTSITRHSLHICEREYPVIDPKLILERYEMIYGNQESPDMAGSYVEDGDATDSDEEISRV
ncbi:MAG: hypothetical protein JW746_01830 [Candidatus Krumholzibacteriota bacterium]|nr:hypothetical protein [Candidatus Krumholzibacteriota bacterium]